jgi:hypothetical protein
MMVLACKGFVWGTPTLQISMTNSLAESTWWAESVHMNDQDYD